MNQPIQSLSSVRRREVGGVLWFALPDLLAAFGVAPEWLPSALGAVRRGAWSEPFFFTADGEVSVDAVTVEGACDVLLALSDPRAHEAAPEVFSFASDAVLRALEVAFANSPQQVREMERSREGTRWGHQAALREAVRRRGFSVASFVEAVNADLSFPAPSTSKSSFNAVVAGRMLPGEWVRRVLVVLQCPMEDLFSPEVCEAWERKYGVSGGRAPALPDPVGVALAERRARSAPPQGRGLQVPSPSVPWAPSVRTAADLRERDSNSASPVPVTDDYGTEPFDDMPLPHAAASHIIQPENTASDLHEHASNAPSEPVTPASSHDDGTQMTDDEARALLRELLEDDGAEDA